MSAPAVLVLGTADWSMPIATNNHRIASGLAKRFDVTFMESLGLRRMEPSRRDVARVLGRIKRQAMTRQRRPTERLRVVPSLLVPFHRSEVAASLNRRLLRWQIRNWLRRAASDRVLWTFSPITYGLEGLAAVCVYHCVDLIAEVPGVDRSVVEDAEKRLAGAGASAVASSSTIGNHLQDIGFERVCVWENVADTTLFSQQARVPEERTPTAVFAGRLSSYKVDFDLLDALARRMHDAKTGRLVLAGPVQEEDARDLRRKIDHLSGLGVEVVGNLSAAQLSELLGGATVGIIPYLENEYVRGVFPLKLWEYLAAGLFVVSVRLPSLSDDIEGHMVRVDRDDAFARSVMEHLAPPTADVIRERIDLASSHSWERRAEEARALIEELVASERR